MPARGFGRFRGAGSQWKTSWRGKPVTLNQMRCIQGFEGGQFYIAGADLAPLDFVNGSWFAAVVGINEFPAPGTYQGIAMGSTTGANAWDLSFTSTGNAVDSVLFRLRLNVGDPTEMVFGNTFEIIPDPSLPGLGYEVFYRVFVQALPADGGAPNGRVSMYAENRQIATPGSGGNLANPYLAAVDPNLVLGNAAADTDQIQSPNCIHGFVAGTSTSELSPVQAVPVETPFFVSIEEQYQMTEPPGVTASGAPAVGFSVLHGWRANNPPLPLGDAPNPLLPYVGVSNLQYGALLVPNLTVVQDSAAFAQEIAP
jgi:hypothetical protein